MSDKVIYLDMDGVICDFMYGLLWAHNREDLIERYENNQFPLDWNIEGALGDDAAIWKPIEDYKGEFWYTLSAYDEKDRILQTVQEYDCPWYICTTPYYPDTRCVDQKVRWLKDCIDPNMTNIIMMKDKYLLANDNAILIDDSESNCDKFQAHGGHAFLWPRPWNRNRKFNQFAIPNLQHALRTWRGDIVHEYA